MSSPLERYLAYKESKGLSETAATVTKPQSYNIRSGGISAKERSTIDSIREQQAKDREANRIQQEKYWRITTAKKEDVPKIILSQPDTPNTSKGNMAQYFKERDIDPLKDPVKPDWLTPQKQTELREKLKQESQERIIEKSPPYVAINQPQEARASPRGAGQITVQPETLGRIETPKPIINTTERKIETPQQLTEEIPIKEEKNNNLLIIAAVGIFAVLGFVIWRMKK